jgi:hypothetical protein
MKIVASDGSWSVISCRLDSFMTTQQQEKQVQEQQQAQQQAQPTVFDLPKVLAVGIVSPAAAAITSRFGIGGTLVGLFLSSVIITAGVDLLKVYLARVPGAVTTIPGGLRKKSSLRNIFERMKRPFSKFASLPRPRRRSLLIGSLAAAGISCLVGLILVTVLELGVGKSLSCWVWAECSTEESSADGGGGTTRVSTLPTILGGCQSASTQSASSTTPSEGVNAPNPQQQRGSSAGTPQGAPSQAAPPGIGGSGETPDASPGAQPAQRQGVPGSVTEDQQQSPTRSAPTDQQPSSADSSESQ